MSAISEILHALKTELPSNVTLVAVSKFHPAEAVMEAYDAGQRVFGESRPQELQAKAAALPKDIRWHFIGHLQTNKLKMVLPYVSLVESVDSEHLLAAIDGWAATHERIIDLLLEMHIAAEETKQGFVRDEILDVLHHAAEGKYRNVRILGLMGMATLTDDEAVIRSDFSKLISMRDEIRSDKGLAGGLPENFGLLSFGMTHDYKIAVAMGADIVRIGTLIFGQRI